MAIDVEGEVADFEGCGLSSKGGGVLLAVFLTSLEHCPSRLSLTFDSTFSD